MAEYTDENTYDEINDGLNWGGKAMPFLLAALGADAKTVAAGGAALAGGWIGNEIGHFFDGRNGMGVDPETGRERDIFDVAADRGHSAEDWVEAEFGSTEGDGSFGDIAGGIAGGATAGLAGIGGVAVEGSSEIFEGLSNLF